MSGDNLAREREREEARRVLILTGGEDVPGLNAVVRAFVKAAAMFDLEVYASEDGFAGLVDDPARTVRLTPQSVRGILHLGGTILGCSDRVNPFAYRVVDADGTEREVDVSERVLANLEALGIETLVLVGGHGTLEIGMGLAKLGVSIIGIPRSVDNDLAGTDVTFGLDTAVAGAMWAIDALHTSADAHDQVSILEVAGFHSGWIALMAGIAGGADVVLIPEVPYDIDRVVEKIQTRAAQRHKFSIVVVAEGSKPLGGTVSNISDAHESNVHRHESAAFQLARLLEGRLEQDVRVTLMANLQRGGSPSPRDRLLGTRFGVHAAELCYHENTGVVVAMRGQEVVSLPLEAAVAGVKRVPPDGELITVARLIGIELGQE
jgi:6-phosphofructokinase 1